MIGQEVRRSKNWSKKINAIKIHELTNAIKISVETKLFDTFENRNEWIFFFYETKYKVWK